MCGSACGSEPVYKADCAVLLILHDAQSALKTGSRTIDTKNLVQELGPGIGSGGSL